MKIPLLTTVLLGGVAALDATPLAQTLLSQPLVTATILGLVWGDLGTALQVGLVLQVLAASTMPVGSRTPEDYAVGGVVGAGVALGLAQQGSFGMVREASAMLGVLCGMVTATAGVPLLKWQRRRNETLSRWCEDELRAGNERALEQSHAAAVVLAFGVGVGYSALCLAVGLAALAPLAAHESLRLAKAWTLAQPLWIGLGLAHILHVFVQRRLLRGAVFGAALLLTWVAIMVGTPEP